MSTHFLTVRLISPKWVRRLDFSQIVLGCLDRRHNKANINVVVTVVYFKRALETRSNPIYMTTQCEKCGADYSGMTLEWFAKYSNLDTRLEIFIWIAIAAFGYACYYFESIFAMFLSALAVVAIINYIVPDNHWYCDTCMDEMNED